MVIQSVCELTNRVCFGHVCCARRLRVSAWSRRLGTSSAGSALCLHPGARRGRGKALGGAGRQRRGVESAELLVVLECRDGRMRHRAGSADRAGCGFRGTSWPAHHTLGDAHQRLPLTDHELDRFRRLNDPNHPRAHPQDADLTARRHQARRGRSGVEAAVARPRGRRRSPDLKLEDAAVHDRFPDQHGGIVH